MPEILAASDFLNRDWPTIDVRSPGEFAHAHIPGAINIPLFSDTERAEVGTIYKKNGKEEAVALGLKFAGVKLTDFISTAKKVAPEKKIKVHCWRGGMRSASMAWLFETAGLQVAILEGGYKSYRKRIREILSLRKNIVILAGMTGTGKTDILAEMEKLGEQILDLEKLASHRGSSFGNIGLPEQPSTEEFENKIAFLWEKIDPNRNLWIEAESLKIGTCVIPPEIHSQMSKAPAIQIERPLETRIKILTKNYGNFDKKILLKATERIHKKLGGLHTKEAMDAILQGNIERAIEIILSYYDKTYTHAFKNRNIIQILPVGNLNPAEAARLILQQVR